MYLVHSGRSEYLLDRMQIFEKRIGYSGDCFFFSLEKPFVRDYLKLISCALALNVSSLQNAPKIAIG
jgi:hypothetical protein